MSDIDHGFIEELRWNVSDAQEFQKKTGHEAVFPLPIVEKALEQIETLKSAPVIINSYADAVNVLQALSRWLCADNRAHYMCIDTKQTDDDGRNLAAVAHSLRAEEQFVAVHQLLEGSRLQRLRENG